MSLQFHPTTTANTQVQTIIITLLEICAAQKTETTSYMAFKLSTAEFPTSTTLAVVISTMTATDTRHLWTANCTGAFSPMDLRSSVGDIRFKNAFGAERGIPENMIVTIPRACLIGASLPMSTTLPNLVSLKETISLRSLVKQQCQALLPLLNGISSSLFRIYWTVDAERERSAVVPLARISSTLKSSPSIGDIFQRASLVQCPEEGGLPWLTMFHEQTMRRNVETLQQMFHNPTGYLRDPEWSMQPGTPYHPTLLPEVVAAMATSPENVESNYQLVVTFLNHLVTGLSAARHDARLWCAHRNTLQHATRCFLDFERILLAPTTSLLFSAEMARIKSASGAKNGQPVCEHPSAAFLNHEHLLPSRLSTLRASKMSLVFESAQKPDSPRAVVQISEAPTSTSTAVKMSDAAAVAEQKTSISDTNFALAESVISLKSSNDALSRELESLKALLAASEERAARAEERITQVLAESASSSSSEARLSESTAESARQARATDVRMERYETRIFSTGRKLERALDQLRAKEDEVNHLLAQNLNLQDMLEIASKRHEYSV